MQHADIILANPRGFCAGVDRAIEIVERALALFGAPVYVRHEIVHNQYVVSDLKSKGAIFVAELTDIPTGGIAIFSAHGVAQAVHEEAARLGLQVFDATCPLVTKVHLEVARAGKMNHDCILIGHKGHVEVIGTMGQYRSDVGSITLVEDLHDVAALNCDLNKPLHYMTQTTLSVDETKIIIAALQAKYPHIQGPKRDDICYATQNRQDAIKTLSAQVDVVLVVGSHNSSNSNRLAELSRQLGTPAYLIDGPDNLQPEWFDNVARIGLTAGASAPEVLVQSVVQRLQAWGAGAVLSMEGVPENMVFALPKTLRDIPVVSM